MRIHFFALSALCLTASPAIAETALDTPIDTPAVEEKNPDESAADLNAQQQIIQTFTLKRSINGQVVETTKKSVVTAPGAPYRETEAGGTVLQQVRDAFDREVLSRVEAFEEAKLDFAIADTNRDNRMNADEFVGLVRTWREVGAETASLAPKPLVAEPSPPLGKPQSREEARQRQFEALFGATNEIKTDEQKAAEYAQSKFAFISGAAPTISREDYIREYLLDFDTMDSDQDTFLRGEELDRFRTSNRGEAVLF